MKKMVFFRIIPILAIVSFCQLSWCDAAEVSSNDLTSVFNAMFSGDAEFPPRFAVNPAPVIENPGIRIFISQKHLNTILAAYLKHPIPLGHKSDNTGNSIRADKLVVKPDIKRNILHVYILGGILQLDNSYAGVGGKLTLKNAEFELAPVCKKNKQGKLILETRVRCVGLDIDGTAPMVDIGMAHLLQELYLDKQPIEPVDLTELVQLQNKKNGPPLDIQLDKAAVVMMDKGIEIQSSWRVN
ncbi:MAG: hypothetical protein KKD44_06435 [Proteobacteria bacterium]|nr:hypothetical protein [Pseudomonadota bacterium]